MSAKFQIDDEQVEAPSLIREPFSPTDIELSTPPMNLGDLIDMIKYGWINFHTDYQRGQDLWSSTQQSRLIESALLGLRLPAFYFEEVDKRHWNIIDGLQRCCALKNFCVDETLRLTNLEFLGEFEGCTYEQLNFDTVRDIRMLPITVNVLSKGVPEKAKYILFKRLNTGGIPLNSQEIRNAVYQGQAMDVVKKLADSSCFLSATGKAIPQKRMQDLDFVSRFLAFYCISYIEYTPDLNNFINSAMEVLSAYDGTQITNLLNDFDAAMRLSMEIFGRDAFRKRVKVNARRKPFNKAYFEVIASTFALIDEEKRNLLLAHKDLFLSNCIEAMAVSQSYNRSFSGGTAKEDSVLRRHQGFRDIITYSINNKKIEFNDDNKIKHIEF